MKPIRLLRLAPLLLCALPLLLGAAEAEKPRNIQYVTHPPAPLSQSPADAEAKSAGCNTCHTKTDQPTMHASPSVVLGCTDCHGGNAAIAYRGEYPWKAEEVKKFISKDGLSTLTAKRDFPTDYFNAMEQAHVLPRYPKSWRYPASRNPERSYTLLNREAPEFTRFVNPGDLRIAEEACGACHLQIIEAAKRSLMASVVMFWGGASYNNGILPYKRYILGEAYTREGEAAGLTNPLPIGENERRIGIIDKFEALPSWETIPPADVFRVFERGGRNIANLFPETGLPNSVGQIQRLEEPGRPDIRQSNRGPGTGQRIAVPVLNIHKTRLNDPNMWFAGTNDQPGDWRQSGCTACHVIYANDRDPRHSAGYAQFGHWGQTQTADPTIPKGEPGHPLKHAFTRAIPTSQCMICHMHQPNMFINSMLGYTMWDYESDAALMWPEKQHYPSEKERHKTLMRNPEEASQRGNWRDLNFVSSVWELNDKTKDTTFADYHGHGWNFRAIYKRDREGNLLDKDGGIVANDDPKKFKKAVHMSSIHVDVGMQCIDCHFSQDMHGNGHIVSEVAAAVEIGCIDCHGTADKYPTLLTSNALAPPQGRNLALLRNPDGKKRFEWINGELIQRSVVTPGLEWKMSLVKDSVNPTSGHYNAKSARAKLMSTNTTTQAYGLDVPVTQRAHKDDNMMCYTCHLSWTTSCGGCHLPIQANEKTDRHHYEGGETRNFATYNPQVARDDMFFLGKHGIAKNYAIAPVRSSSALVLSSTNSNREKIYIQQPPVSAAGYSSQAFAPHYPHTERKTETKTCSDCHLSAANDNNAIIAQTLLLGTRFVDFLGYNAWVGQAKGIDAIQVTEWDEPQAVIGSYLHRYAYPDWYKGHVDHSRELKNAQHHSAGETQCLQLRGEYLFAAEGAKGMRVYDAASIANKGVSQKLITAPFSPLGHDTHIASSNATCVVLPTTQPIAPFKNEGDLMRKENLEQPFHPIYNYAFITDSVEGLILTDINTLADGEPRNNFLERKLTWNPNGALNGAKHLTIAGNTFYITTTAGLAIVDMTDPLKPALSGVIALDNSRASAVQFRYLLVSTRNGIETFDITSPLAPRSVPGANVALKDAQKIHWARTYVYVANGAEGIAILDAKVPTALKLKQMYNADGAISDARDITLAATNASLFAYVADGRNGLKVLQVFSPGTQPNFYGFSPEPKPELIASYNTRSPALSLSRALERDRAVDESGGQIAILGRLGSRPFNLEEMRKLYLDRDGKPWFTEDNPDRPTAGR
jgi:hypothetical protein